MESQSLEVLRTLFPSKARRAVLTALFSGKTNDASVSELARRAKLTPRAVAVEVEKLERAGLVEVEAVGPSHVVRPNSVHPVAPALSRLLIAIASSSTEQVPATSVRESLAAYGAPLLDEPRASLSLTDAILHGLKLARRDATVLRVLPVVVARNASNVDWTDLKDRARRMKLKSELGMLLELTADVADAPSLRRHASGLHDARRKRPRYFPMVESEYEQKLALRRSPPSATRWHFAINMTEDAFRSTVKKHA
jgi:DNA-binding transcriptional ArsR family regulator